jgi:hypothetical protein
LRAVEATSHFEQCIASVCQATLLFDRIVKLADKSDIDDARYTAIRKIWNRSKHFDEDLEKSEVDDKGIVAPVWLTNTGISCMTAEITFGEVHSYLTDLLKLFTSAFDTPRAPTASG